MLTVFVVGTVAGATYAPVALIVPTVALPPAMPFTDQVTAVLVVPVTVAENVCVSPARMLGPLGVTLTLITLVMLSVKLCVAFAPTPFCAVIVRG